MAETEGRMRKEDEAGLIARNKILEELKKRNKYNESV